VTALLTVGHGTAPRDRLAALLTGAGVRQLVDVRRFPVSRRWPDVGRDALASWLPAAGVGYRWDERLGGRRPPVPDSPDVALRNPSFRAYAGWMRSVEFRAGLADLLAAAAAGPTAVMCSESLWWRCHRRLIADVVVLTAGVPMRHLLPDGRTVDHLPTAGIRVVDGLPVYDAAPLPDPA
jgi:uncharacterized protein (DUF488 family)